MFGIGGMELVVILIVALLVLGPKQLPKVARAVGKAMSEFRKVSTEFQRTMNLEAVAQEEAENKAKAKAEQAASNNASTSTATVSDDAKAKA